MSGATNRLGGVGVYLVSVLGIAAIVFLVFTSLSRATKAPITVSPMVLPTRVIDATPTPTTASRVDQEWVKVEVAWTKSDWNSAIRSLDSILQMSPDDEQATGQLADALLQRALDSVEANDLEAAKADLDRAIKCDASKVEVRQVRSDLEGYLEGVRYYQAQQWQLAVDALTEVYAEAAGFRDTASLLADSYRELGSEALESQDWYGAQEQFEACLSYEPANQSCLKDLDEVASIITPPTRIEVSLITRICDVYEDGEIIKTFQVCTGRPSSPTVAGRYEILDKIEEGAYASAWDLDMPYWMGIYWAGGSENGFHAYPLRGGSQVLWQGSLGTGCSFGCIVLDTYDAEWLYNWAEIGTVVFVRD